MYKKEDRLQMAVVALAIVVLLVSILMNEVLMLTVGMGILAGISIVSLCRTLGKETTTDAY